MMQATDLSQAEVELIRNMRLGSRASRNAIQHLARRSADARLPGEALPASPDDTAPQPAPFDLTGPIGDPVADRETRLDCIRLAMQVKRIDGAFEAADLLIIARHFARFAIVGDTPRLRLHPEFEREGRDDA